MPASSHDAVQQLLMKKSGQALAFLAQECLTVSLGERIPTFTQFAQRSPFSRGTLQNAMAGLEEIGAVQLVRRGHLGTFLTHKDTGLLMQCRGVRLLTGTMPLPYTKKYEGLATGLFHNFRQRGLDLDIAYIRGSEKRIQGVLGGRYDFAITSQLSAEAALQAGLPIEIRHSFGPGSYLTGQSILFRDSQASEITDGMRIGIDTVSLDHVRLTHALVGQKQVTYLPVNYNQIMVLIRDNQIDAAIWNMDSILESQSQIHYRKLELQDFQETTAVLVMAQANAAMAKVVDEFIDTDDILNQQRKVVAGEIYPNY